MFKIVSRLLIALVFLANFSVFSAAKTQDQTYDQIKLLLDVLQITQDKYVTEVDTQKLIYSAASGMLKPLDPFTQFMEPKIYKEMKIETEGKYGGLGIRISVRDNWLTIISPLPGTPAYKLGLLPEDKIIKIDSESTQGITMEEAVKKLRGDPGTKVRITIAREGLKDPVDYDITREIIKLESSRSKMLNDKIGYIHLLEFNNNSMDDMRKGLAGLKAKGMDGLVFDLRNNPGGLLDVAVEIAKLFVGDNKMVVYTQGRMQDSYHEFRAGKEAPWKDLPIVVLINRGSASASEIVSGCLQDHKRALVVGERSFGKASVQSVIPLQDGCALKITVAKYYTPSGKLIQVDTETKKGGIDPDIKIEVPLETQSKLQMQEETVYPDGKEPVKAAKDDKVEDTVLNRAVELLKARKIFMQQKEG